MRRFLACAVLTLVLLAVSAAENIAFAQVPRVPVTIALVDQHPFGSERSAISRRTPGTYADGLCADLILITRTAMTPRALTLAVQDLLAVRRIEGDAAESNRVMRIRPTQNREARANGSVLPWAGRVLDDLRAAQPRAIEGLGNARTLKIWLPRQSDEASAHASC